MNGWMWPGAASSPHAAGEHHQRHDPRLEQREIIAPVGEADARAGAATAVGDELAASAIT